MSRPVISVRPHWPTRAAAAQLVAYGFASMPVTDAEGRVHGVVTDADLLRVHRGPRDAAREQRREAAVRDVMRPAGSLPPDADLADVVAYLLDSGMPSVPVVDGGRLVGIVARRDLLRVLACPPDTPRSARGDLAATSC
ncbi:MAG: HPP family protein [Pseudonocardia sp.]